MIATRPMVLEPKEALAGCGIVDVATRSAARDLRALARRRHWGMEIRALMQGDGAEG